MAEDPRSYRSWGRVLPPATRATVVDPAFDRLPAAGSGSFLPFGNGRSYGDSCLNQPGTLLDTRRINGILDFDPETGHLRCGGGALLGEILRRVVPAGWFVPVVPGTQHVTVGGAIANDIHGKNHHRAGTFGRHVTRFALVRSDGSTTECSRDQHSEWFRATVGGLGLTGVIKWADLQLTPVQSRRIDSESIRFGRLSDFFHISDESDDTHEYTVAWIDCLASGRKLGRGWFYRGNHSEDGRLTRERPPRKTVGFRREPAISLLRRTALRLFNSVYYHRPLARARTVDYESFFFPLDRLTGWNLLYGPAGFYQFQCVVPSDGGEAIVGTLLRQVAGSGQGSFLAVLKIFGAKASPGLLSFPRPGPTLALDFPNRGPDTHRLFATLERIVIEAGGAIYPAKDLLMSREAFQRSFPRWPELETVRDPQISSDFWRRATGCG